MAAMLPGLPPLRALLEPAETLLIALAGGVALTLLGFPAGLVSGSVLAVATAALFGRPVRVPIPLARACYVIVGILLGAVVTPQTVSYTHLLRPDVSARAISEPADRRGLGQ